LTQGAVSDTVDKFDKCTQDFMQDCWQSIWQQCLLVQKPQSDDNIWGILLLQSGTTRCDVRHERRSFCTVFQSLPPSHSFAWQRSSHH